jgi:NAD-dependent SIR2 family protein deacetylase
MSVKAIRSSPIADCHQGTANPKRDTWLFESWHLERSRRTCSKCAMCLNGDVVWYGMAKSNCFAFFKHKVVDTTGGRYTAGR